MIRELLLKHTCLSKDTCLSKGTCLSPKRIWYSNEHFKEVFLIMANTTMAWKFNGLAYSDTRANQLLWMKNHLKIRSMSSTATWSAGTELRPLRDWKKATYTRCGDTDAELLAPGFQPFGSGKGRHDEAMLTVCNRRSDIFWMCFCFCFKLF